MSSGVTMTDLGGAHVLGVPAADLFLLVCGLRVRGSGGSGERRGQGIRMRYNVAYLRFVAQCEHLIQITAITRYCNKCYII